MIPYNERYVEYARSCNNSWQLVEKPIVDYAVRRFLRTRYNGVPKERMVQTGIGLKIPTDFRVLDLGTGAGRGAKFLIDCGVKAENIVGVDLQRGLMESADFPKGVEMRVGDVTELEKVLEDGEKFDFVLANMLFHMIDFSKYVQCLTVVKEHLRTNSEITRYGSMLVIVPHPIMRDRDTIAGYHEQVRLIEATPWGDEVLVRHKTIQDYVRAWYEASMHVSFLHTNWMGAAEVDNNVLVRDDDVWLNKQQGVTREQVPYKYLRLWMFGS